MNEEAEPNNMLAVIERASRSPEVDVEKMRALLDMQKELVRYQAEMAFNADFAAMQSDLPRNSVQDQLQERRSHGIWHAHAPRRAPRNY